MCPGSWLRCFTTDTHTLTPDHSSHGVSHAWCNNAEQTPERSRFIARLHRFRTQLSEFIDKKRKDATPLRVRFEVQKWHK